MKTSLLNSLWLLILFSVEPFFLSAQDMTTDTFRIQEVVVTGTPVKVSRNNIPMAVSIVDRNQIDDSGESALLTVLSGRVPGLFVTERGITGFGVAAGSAGQITIRGIGGNPTTGVLMLIDGHPQFMGIMGHPLADSYVASDVERVEVIRGPASILYGSNAMGGVINIITKKQTKEGFNGNARLSYGSYNTQKYQVSGGFKKNRFSFLASGNHDQTDGHRKNSDFSIYNGYTKLTWEPGTHFYVSADFSLAGYDASDPGPDTLRAMPGQRIDITRGYTALNLQHDFSKIKGFAKFFYNFGEHNITDGFHSRDHNYGINMAESYKPTENTSLSFGVDWVNYGGLAENIKAMNGKGVIFADTSVIETGLYGFVQQTIFRKLTLNAGLRYQHHTVYNDAWIPSAGFAWKLDERSVWKSSVSKGFRSPTIRELFLWGPNPRLLPEKIICYEASFLHEFSDQKVNLEITLFKIKGDNLIVNVPLKGLLNSGKVDNNGIEFSIDTRMTKNLNLHGTYSYINMQLPVYATPEHQFFIDARYRLNQFLFTASLQQIVNLDTDPSSLTLKQSYALLKTKVAFDLSKNFQLYLSGDNLLNQHFEVNRYYTMPGITLFSGLTIQI